MRRASILAALPLCWGRGVTVGYEPRAYADALGGVKAFLTTIAAGR